MGLWYLDMQHFRGIYLWKTLWVHYCNHFSIFLLPNLKGLFISFGIVLSLAGKSDTQISALFKTIPRECSLEWAHNIQSFILLRSIQWFSHQRWLFDYPFYLRSIETHSLCFDPNVVNLGWFWKQQRLWVTFFIHKFVSSFERTARYFHFCRWITVKTRSCQIIFRSWPNRKLYLKRFFIFTNNGQSAHSVQLGQLFW